MDALYRPEAIAAARAPVRGTPLQARQPSWRALLWLLTPAVLVGGLLLATVSLGERIRSEGVLLPAGGLRAIAAPIDGTVTAVYRAQGDAVVAGEPLFALSAEATDAGLQDGREQRQQRLATELADALHAAGLATAAGARRRAGLEARVDSLSADADSLQRQQALDRQRVALAEQKLPGLRRLAARGLISALQLNDHEAQLLALRAEGHARERQQHALQRELAATGAELAALPGELELEQAGHARDAAALREQLAELERGRERVLRAPIDGELAALLLQPGDAVVAGQALASLAPRQAPLRAVVLVPTSASGLLRVGHAATVRLPAFPYQRFGHLDAEVVEISGAPLSPQQLARDGLVARGAQPMYRVVLALAPPPAGAPGLALRAGMTVHADLLLGKRRLLAWLLDPLGRLAGSGA